MSTGSAMLVVLIVAVMTYSMRAGIIVAMADRTIPAPIERALRNVGPAVLAALTINLAVGGSDGVGLEVAEGAALVVAAMVSIWRKNLVLTLVAGMGTLWLISWIL